MCLLATLAVAAYGDSLPSTSLYVQDGLIGHLDAIENGGVGVHNNSPSEWTDHTGNQTFYCDGTNVLHSYTKNSLDPTLSTLAFGATPNGSSPLNAGAEICARCA